MSFRRFRDSGTSIGSKVDEGIALIYMVILAQCLI